MYSSFARNSYYVYLADAAGHPLATRRFGLTTPNLKKIFESKRRAQFRQADGGGVRNVDEAAGIAVLRYLEELPVVQSRQRALLPGLQIRRVDILWKAGRITAETRIVAQHE